MIQFGNIAEDATIDFKFYTTKADGSIITLAGSPVLAVYKTNNTTESTAGITLTVDFDSRTGMHHVRIDTSAAAFYAINNDYQVVLTAGTVDGKSVVGYVIAQFSIENRVVDSNLKKINGNSVVGNVATLTLKQLDVQNSAGTAMIAKSTGGGGHGIEADGNGAGDGIRANAQSSGSGIHATGTNGMKLDAGSNGYGIYAIGIDGIRAEGGVLDISGNGIKAFSSAGGGNGDGIEATGKGTGHGMELIKGATGKDIDADEIDEIKAKTDNLPHSIKKNTAIAKFKFVMLDATTGNPAAGFSITATRKLDAGATWTAMPGSGTIVDNGSGVYSIDINAADTNGDTGVWRFTAPGAETTFITFVTEVL